MRAGNLYHRIKFYAKVIIRDSYGASTDTWPVATISTRGEVRYVGGNKTLNNEEKFYSKSVELTVRYDSDIVETMKIQIDETNDLWDITYMEVLGSNEGLRLTIEKCADGLSATIIDPPTVFLATFDTETNINLAWTNNIDEDITIIERSVDGSTWGEIYRAASGTSIYADTYLNELTRYFYRVRHINYPNYSAYATIDDATTGEYILPSTPTNLTITSIDETSLQIDWDNMGSDAYQIWVSDTEAGEYIQLNGNLVTNTYIHTIEVGSIYWYKVRGVRNIPLLYGSFCAAVEAQSYPTCLDDGHHWWYDPTDLTQITKDGSNFVSIWKSKGITERDLKQATGTSQPLWISPGTIRFDGLDNFMKTAAFTWNQPEFIYMIVNQLSFTDNDVLFDGNSNYYGTIYQDNPSPNIVATAGTVSSPSSDLAVGGWGIVRVLFNGANSKLIVNDNAPITGNFGALNMGGFTIGSRATGTGLFSNIEVKDIICCNQDDAANETEIYNWLLTRKP